MNPDILTTLEAARYVRLSKPTLERARVAGDGPRYCKLGGSVRYRRADLDAWLESRLTASTSADDHGTGDCPVKARKAGGEHASAAARSSPLMHYAPLSAAEPDDLSG